MPGGHQTQARLSHDDPNVIDIATAAGITADLGDAREITIDDRSFPLLLIDPGHRSLGSVLDELSGVPDGVVRIVTGKINVDLRSALDHRKVSWIDQRGAAHLVTHGIDQHFGRIERLGTEVPPNRPGLRLGHATVRAVQLVLDSQADAWRVTDLANRARISKGRSSGLLRGLVNLGFMNAVGIAPALHFEIGDRSGLARWFLEEPATRAKRERARVFAYARNPQDLAQRIARSGIAPRVAISGGLGALVSGVGMTAVPSARVWVDPDIELVDAIDDLDADSSPSAPNVILQRDVGRVAMLDRRLIDTIPVAPPSRIWVDLHDEPRGEDQAVLYRESRCAF